MFWGKIVERLWNFRLEEPLSVKSSVAYSLEVWNMRAVQNRSPACDVSEGSLKTLLGPFVILN